MVRRLQQRPVEMRKSRTLSLLILLAAQLPAFPAWAVVEGCEPGLPRFSELARAVRDASDLVLDGEEQTPISTSQPAVRGENLSSIGIELGDRMLVEGSWSVGGSQPDFWIDYRDASLFERIVAPAREIGRGPGDVWEKIRQVQQLVNRTLPHDGHHHVPYERHAERASQVEDRVASLGEYVDLQAGVCRENALLTTLALREAGIDARYGYFHTFVGGESHADHAVALVEVDDVTYVVDSFWPFGSVLNGHRLIDLLRPPADGRYPHAGPLHRTDGVSPAGYRLEPNDFPRVRAGDLDADFAPSKTQWIRDLFKRAASRLDASPANP